MHVHMLDRVYIILEFGHQYFCTENYSLSYIKMSAVRQCKKKKCLPEKFASEK